MKSIVFITVLLLFNCTAFCQKGVNFENLTFDEALTKAKIENKRVFIDCCTKYCGACIQIARNLFPLENVGNILNKNFICLKYDMNKGEGLKIGKKFNVKIYPTFLIIEQDGTIRHRFVGNCKEDEFIRQIEEGLDENTALKNLTAQYNSGNRDKSLLFQYTKNLINLKDPAISKVIEDLLKVSTDKDKTSEEYWFIFKDDKLCPRNSCTWKYLHDHRKEFYKTIGVKKVDSRLARELNNEMRLSISGRNPNIDKKRLTEIAKEIKALDLATEKSLLASLSITQAACSGDIDKLLSICTKKLELVQNERSTLIHYLSIAFENATATQKTRWQELIKSL